MSNTKRMYFSFDGSDFENHDSLEEARERAEDALERFAAYATDGWWDELVDQVQYGEVLGRVVENGRRPVTDDDQQDEDVDVEEFVNYELRPIEVLK